MYDLILLLVLLVLGYVFGQLAEKRHFRSIIKREAELRDVLCFTERNVPEMGRIDSALVCGSVVISIDFFKKFVAGLRNMEGGRARAYESLLEPARREDVLPMKGEGQARGAKSVWNVRIETSSITKDATQGVAAVEVIAFGTAVTPR